MHLRVMRTMLAWSSNLLLIKLIAAKKPSSKQKNACRVSFPIGRDVLSVDVAVDHKVLSIATRHLSKKLFLIMRYFRLSVS